MVGIDEGRSPFQSLIFHLLLQSGQNACSITYRSGRRKASSETDKYHFGRGAHESRYLLPFGRSKRAQWSEILWVPSVEVHGMRCVDEQRRATHRSVHSSCRGVSQINIDGFS